MANEKELGSETGAGEAEDHEPRRTLVVIAFVLGLAAWVLWGVLHYRAMHYVPDFPSHGTKIVTTPRSTAALNAFIYAEWLALLASLVSVVALFMNPRTLMAVLLCLPGPLLVAWPFAALLISGLI